LRPGVKLAVKGPGHPLRTRLVNFEAVDPGQERTTKNCSAMPLSRRTYIQRYISSLSWHRYAAIKGL
jgi:hypothetical protein